MTCPLCKSPSVAYISPENSELIICADCSHWFNEYEIEDEHNDI
jgi:uncharacterized protein YbaR (Trm112 family)